MIVYCLLIATMALAVHSMLLLWRHSRQPLRKNWHLLVLPVSLACFVYLYGAWVFLSVYCKYAYVCCFCLLFLVSLFRRTPPALYKKGSRTQIASVVVSCILILMIALYYTGTTGRPYGVADLRLPFKSGTYFVFQGGKGLPTNIFHSTGRHTHFAMDIIKLNKYGRRSSHIFSKRLEDYEIFGDTIYAPCNGIVVKTEASNPDNIPPARKRGRFNLNHVLIESRDAFIFLGHLKQGGVLVKAGDTLVAGQPIGLAGNSGMSLEPHLHIQVHAKTTNGLPWYLQPQLSITFDGKSYLLFDEIKTGGRWSN